MPPIDPYAGATGPNGSLRGAFAITPHVSDELTYVTRQIYAAGGGNVEVVWADGATSIEPIAAGERVNWRIRAVRAASTTATGLRGYY